MCQVCTNYLFPSSANGRPEVRVCCTVLGITRSITKKTYAVKALLSRRKGVAAALATVKSITEVISTVTGAVSVMNVVAIGPAVKFVDGDGVKYVV